jgi:hypothetical protein
MSSPLRLVDFNLDVVETICSFLLYTKEVLLLRRTCKALYAFDEADLYDKSAHVQPHGVHVESFLGRMFSVHQFRDGHQHGRQSGHDRNGNLYHTWDMKNGVMNGMTRIVHHWNTGTDIALAQVSWSSNGVQTGLSVSSGSTGKIFRVENWDTLQRIALCSEGELYRIAEYDSRVAMRCGLHDNGAVRCVEFNMDGQLRSVTTRKRTRQGVIHIEKKYWPVDIATGVCTEWTGKNHDRVGKWRGVKRRQMAQIMKGLPTVEEVSAFTMTTTSSSSN